MFSFQPNFEFIDFGSLKMDLAYLGTANTVNKNNLRCMFLKDSIISHDIAGFNMDDLTYITANFKEKNSNKPTSLG